MTEELHRNLIAGDWVEGEGTSENINPSNTDDVVGDYARAVEGRRRPRHRRRQGGVPGLVALRHPRSATRS